MRDNRFHGRNVLLMRDVEIVTTKDRYRAGETVEGTMFVRCDKELRCNAIHLTFTGREHTKIEVGDSESSTTYKDERVYFTVRQDFEGAAVVAAGEVQYPFRFRLPDDVPSSYSGLCGWIEYTLTGVVELSWARDLRRKTTLSVIQPAKKPASQSQHMALDRSGRSVTDTELAVFDVELEEDSICLGNPIKLRFRVARDVKTRGVRVELQNEEFTSARRITDKRRWTLSQHFVEELELGREIWVSVKLGTDDSMPVSFDRAIVRSAASIKATLDIPWARDISAVIPVRLSHRAGAYAGDNNDEAGSDWEFM
ncbi:MAG: hypothetical protein HXY34_12415 [Candidatus Thorarchaeota archaeon]|nr:hypothetical protein [Candidatus Thorarchaeota archaeon]